MNKLATILIVFLVVTSLSSMAEEAVPNFASNPTIHQISAENGGVKNFFQKMKERIRYRRAVRKYGQANVDKYGHENIEKYGLKKLDNYGLANIEKYGIANLDKYEPENLEKYGLAIIEKYGLANLEKYRLQDIERLGLPTLQKYGDSKFNTFREFGSIQHIRYVPVNSPLDFEYDVLYYIPESLRNQDNLKTIVFLHGGGSSTMTREGSLNVARMYINDLKSVADSLGVVLIAPSGSAINWGGHMISYLKDLAQTVRTDLPADPNRIALTGHSMGGMGITRSAHWFADEFSFFMPVAAGMDERHQTERHLRPYFNMTYYHYQGLNDHFQTFITRCNAQQRNIDALEAQYGKESKFTLEFHNGSHNYPKAAYQARLGRLLNDNPRDLYQKELHGMLYYRHEVRNDQWSNGNEYFLGPRDRYFWLKGQEFAQELKVALVDTSIEGNQINIQIEEGVVKTLRVYISKKMVDLANPIKIVVNGKIKFEEMADLNADMSFERSRDSGFIFESFVDIDVK